MTEDLFQVYFLDLQKVIKEIESYENEDDLWILKDGISNSAGNLALHLIGNLNHFFGATLGGTGYQRERDEEFFGKNVSREEIIEGLEDCIGILKNVFEDLADEDLQKDYPEEFGGEVRKTGTIVIYMLSHLNYHLGQINYHRRLLAS
jgi:hypothetical protein